MPTYNPNDFYPKTDAEVKSDGTVVYLENTTGTLLPSATRTAFTSAPQQTNYNARGVIVFLNVTAASGTGGLVVRIRGVDPVSGNGVYLNPSPTAIITAGTTAYTVYPGIASVNQQGYNYVLPKLWSVDVNHNDATSYTYSLNYCYII